MRHLVSVCLALAALALVLPAQVLAQPSCGYSPASWNAPNGAVVFSRGPGPIRDVLDAIGEYRTHSMLSHGPGAGVTHGSMKIPSQNSWPTICNVPINANQLRWGYPGIEHVNQGAIYQFMHGDASLTEWSGYQLGNPSRAAAIGDTIAYNYPYAVEASQVDGSQTFRRLLRYGSRINYSLFQYRALEWSHWVPGSSENNGMVCSTFLAYAHNYAGQGFVPEYVYPHDKIANASNSLYSGTTNTCRAALGWFQGALLTVVCPFVNVCGYAGNQVANCMSNNRCDTNDYRIWSGMRDDPNTVAVSISPDRLGGWGVHPTTTTLWAPDYTHQLQWSSGGSVYGCWN
jgi:hypothetical protein